MEKLRLLLCLSVLLLSSCAVFEANDDLFLTKKIQPTSTLDLQSTVLKNLPAAKNKPTIAVYPNSFKDLTGQRRSNSTFALFSTAVTQAPEAFLIRAFKHTANGNFFRVVERVGLDDLTKERQLIRQTRESYEGKDAVALKPLLFAGLILEGGVVGYDSNVAVGGAGARWLGVGASTQYRIDTVTVGIRIVSVATGKVLLSIATEKTIASHQSGADVFRFLDMGTRLLETEIGFSVNEPVNYATRAAIEQAVIELVYEGENKGLWKFQQEGKNEVEDLNTVDDDIDNDNDDSGTSE
jgi:curli production assembly/transport component CsgG